MDNLELQRLRDLPIEGVAERLGLTVRQHKALCPFHDDHHASLSFNLRKNTCRCFVCMDKSLGTIDLVMNSLHKDFLDACRWLSHSHNIITTRQPTPPLQGEAGRGPFDASRYERFFERPFLSESARHFLYDERKIDPRVVRWCRLTSWRDRNGVEWLQIPYYNKEWKLIGIQNRNLRPSKSPLKGDLASAQPSSPSPRFRFPPGSSCSIYNLPVLSLLRPGEDLYITEGASDCWAMLSSGHKAIAIPSATLLKPDDIALLRSLPLGGDGQGNFHMYPDRDEPGERLFMQLREYLPGLVHHQLPPDCKDFGDYYMRKSARSLVT